MFALLSSILISAALLWAYEPALRRPGQGLVFAWEGVLDSKLNFRDAGASINACLGRRVVPEGVLFRAAGYFSGWSCERVGSPHLILSLNFVAAEGQRHYCRTTDGIVVGRSFQEKELADLELVETWDRDAAAVHAVCQSLDAAQAALVDGKRVLVQCSAGRDRTGAVVALLTALYMERVGELNDQGIRAIECDYRKTKSLVPERYGRVAGFVGSIQKSGGVERFLQKRCGDVFRGERGWGKIRLPHDHGHR
jgi:hypothetical protein